VWEWTPTSITNLIEVSKEKWKNILKNTLKILFESMPTWLHRVIELEGATLPRQYIGRIFNISFL
jgi:hypothetical protein